jgi:hypothetical protein
MSLSRANSAKRYSKFELNYRGMALHSKIGSRDGDTAGERGRKAQRPEIDAAGKAQLSAQTLMLRALRAHKSSAHSLITSTAC